MTSFSRFGKAFALNLFSLLPALALLSEDFALLPPTDYDFIIVGGGTAGCVLASRLSEVPFINVLLIEAGPHYAGYLESAVPAYAAELVNTELDWAFTSVPQTGLNNRTDHLARGRVLGGSSAINGQVYTRGSADDWNRYAEFTDDEGWNWATMFPYFLKGEKWKKPSDGHDTQGQYNPYVHSSRGILGVSLSGAPEAIDEKILETSHELNGEFSFDVDMNDGIPLGIGWTQSTVEDGTRVSSATAYLGPAQISRHNLHVLVNNQAFQVVKTGDDARGPVLRTVKFGKAGDPSKKIYTVSASKEAVLCAGTYGTPHLLLLSGIGDRANILDAGITPVVDLPDVGRNLSDHVYFEASWSVGLSDLVDPFADPAIQEQMLAQWLNNRTGPLTSFGFNLLGWIRLPEDWSAWPLFSDPAPGTATPHFEVLIGNRGLQPLPGPTITALLLLLTPTSRGAVSLNVTNPSGDPLIDSRLLDTEFDIQALANAMQTVNRLFSAPTWAEWNLTLLNPPRDVETEEQLQRHIRNTARHGSHCVGTASMSPYGATYGVVDPDLKVKKISGLRVVDASILPYVPAAHTQAPVYAVAEKAANIIRATWGLL